MNAYTVQLFYLPNLSTADDVYELIWWHYTQALSPTHAAHRARLTLEATDNLLYEDWEVLAVFEGVVVDHFEPSLDIPEYLSGLDAEFEAEGGVQ